jgi:hypothetical protein
VPSASCELAGALAMRMVDGDGVEAGVHLLAPEYRERGSTAPPSGDSA